MTERALTTLSMRDQYVMFRRHGVDDIEDWRARAEFNKWLKGVEEAAYQRGWKRGLHVGADQW